MSSIKPITTLAVIVFVFLFAWVLLADYLYVWSDELGNLGQGKAFYLTGEFKSFDFDKNKVINDRIEARDLLLDRVVSFFLSIRPKGSSEILWARLAPLLFTLLTFLLVLFYGFLRFRLSSDSLICLSALFLGQSMVLEESLFVRIYAPLMFCVVGTFICYWEGRQYFLNGKKTMAMVMFLASAAFTGVTILDHWQFEQIPIIVLAIVLSFSKTFEGLVRFLNTRKLQLFFIALGLLIFCPFFVIILDEIMSKMVIGNILIGITFITFWDNVMGLLRSALSLNICLIGVFITIFKDKGKVKFGFAWWIYFVGIISAILGALLNPHSFAFYTRYYLTSVVLALVGFAFVFEEVVPSPTRRKILIILYLLINLFLSFANFYWDRSNTRDAVSWLKMNIGKDEKFLTFNANLGLYGGESLFNRAYGVQDVYDEMAKAKALRLFLKNHPQEKIYYLYIDGYCFRDELYKLTTGEERTIPDSLYNYIDKRIPHQNPLHDLRGGLGVDLFDQKVLENGLDELIKNGYPIRDRNQNISLHKRILKHIFVLLHLPDKREDIRKLERF